MEKHSNIKSIYITYILLDILLLGIFTTFLVLTMVNSNFINSLDSSVFNFVSNLRVPFITNLSLFITFFGETITIVILLIISLIIFKKESFPIIIPTTISAILNYIIKHIVQRARPVGQFVNNLIINYPFPDGYSFPSGHSQTGLVFYFFLFYFLLNKYYKGKHKKLILSLCLILPILIMLSRVILGVHFFTDILCGALFGTLIIINYLFIEKLISMKKTNI